MEICIDIETLSTKKNAHILSIGAVAFNRDTELDRGASLHVFDVSIRRDMQGDRDVDVATVEWWLTQNAEAIRELALDKVRVDIKTALHDLSRFICALGGKKPSIWANSPSFDCDILSNAYEQFEIPRPWMFYQERDVRTAKQLVGEPEFVGVKHFALHDAIHEARIVQRYLKLGDHSNDTRG